VVGCAARYRRQVSRGGWTFGFPTVRPGITCRRPSGAPGFPRASVRFHLARGRSPRSLPPGPAARCWRPSLGTNGGFEGPKPERGWAEVATPGRCFVCTSGPLLLRSNPARRRPREQHACQTELVEVHVRVGLPGNSWVAVERSPKRVGLDPTRACTTVFVIDRRPRVQTLYLIQQPWSAAWAVSHITEARWPPTACDVKCGVGPGCRAVVKTVLACLMTQARGFIQGLSAPQLSQPKSGRTAESRS
jgi:hypothetical protein